MNLVTNLQPAEQIMPAIGSLDDPSPGLESRILPAFLLFLSSRFDMGHVTPARRRATQLGIVVALVTAQVLARCLLGRRSLHHHRIQSGAKSLHVVPVRAGQGRSERQAVGVREGMPLGAKFAAICRVFSGLVPPFTGAETVAESSDWKRQSIP